MIEGLLFLAGTEIGSTARVAQYLARGGPAQLQEGCVCPALPQAIGDLRYQTPATDPAPWYDPAEPRSARFGGLWIETIDGMGPSYERKVTQRVGNGAVKSRGRMASKTLTVTGWLFAADCCAADFGLRWLTAALYSSCSTCAGDDLCFLACCPSVVPADTPGAEQGPDGRWYDTPTQLRTMTGAALIQSPRIVTRAQGCGGGCDDSAGDTAVGLRPIYRVQFVLDVDPCVWREPLTVLDAAPWPAPTGDEPCNVTFTTQCCDPANPGCACSTPCSPDELCPPAPTPPLVPPAVPDCVCIPLQVVRQCVDIPPEQVPTWEEGRLAIKVFAGAQPIRNLAISVWPNLLDRDPADLSDCNTCGRFYVTHVPANSTLTIDGRTCTATLDCPGNATSDASANVYGSAGGPLECVSLSCGIRYTVCADIDINHVAADATLSVDVLRCETSA